MTKDVQIIGHRGFVSKYPENSLIGFLKAAEIGVDGIELDVHLTKDGELVIHHDEKINRMTNGTGWIYEKTLKELQQYQIRHRSRRRLKESIPTLREVFEVLEAYPALLINIELKTSVILYEEIEKKVLELVEQYAPKRPIIYSSFHLPTLIRIKQRKPEAEVALLTRERVDHLTDYMGTFSIDSIHPRKNLYFSNPASYANISSIRPWTVNRRSELEQLLASPVTAVITDYPERALRLRERLD